MEREEAKQEDGKVFEIRDIEIERTYLSPKYTLSYEPIANISGTGRIDVFALTPISGKGPWFVGRWDGGRRRSTRPQPSDLDVDIEGVSKLEKNRFKREERGYSGHHTLRQPSAKGWKYKVSLKTATDGGIFEGEVCFTAHRKLAFLATVSMSARVDRS